MGQAKLRGTQEQRATQALERAAADKRAFDRMREANERMLQRHLAAMPPEARRRYQERERARKLRVASWLAFASSITSELHV